MGWVTDWSAQAACRTTDPDELFVQGAAQNRAKAVCTGCPVRTECLADALDNRVEFGVWGGMTERERRALLRRRPTVTSWRNLLETARTEYERGAGLLPANIDAIGEIDDIDDDIHDIHDIEHVDGMDDEETYESYAAVG
ncbi:WhiB family transcriptional regulator [Streptomyces sp. NPDC091292]|uniref:WhiB family transcriptional regulator n=1 Tax=Streptomyces sp. NPDC091292 TaxID=3365991 RepID=UPI00380B2699